MHQTEVAHRREHCGKRQLVTEHGRFQTAARKRHGAAGTESDVVEGAAVFAQRLLTFGAAVKIIKNRAGQALAGQWTEISDADDAALSNGANGGWHAGSVP